MAVIRMQYLVSQSIDVKSGETGEVIDWQSEDEYYDTLAEARARADELRQLIGEEVCEWGDDYGVLTDVYCDDEPRGIEYCD